MRIFLLPLDEYSLSTFMLARWGNFAHRGSDIAFSAMTGSRPVKRRMWSGGAKEFAASIERQRAQIATTAKALGIQPTRFGFGG